ncbi:hypothetical protein [Streptomyces sp. NPDC048737]|uniref:hypothetical protein n=1 Tax=unclassified Streptomyces TaxID=2593676 RepID=UPI003445FF88
MTGSGEVDVRRYRRCPRGRRESTLPGRLPDGSLHRLDHGFGFGFGVTAGVGALAGLPVPWPRPLLLAVSGGMLLKGLLAPADPLGDWGHLGAPVIGVATWPWGRPRGSVPRERQGAAGSGRERQGAAVPGARAARVARLVGGDGRDR